jgi:hypothetical protein
VPNVAEIIKDHVSLEVRCIDRLYLNAYIPRLQVSSAMLESSPTIYHRPLPLPIALPMATPATLGPCHAHADGFDLHAGLVVPAGQRDRLERVCRYALRPPLAQERLHQTSEGEIWLTLRHRWADGTTHLHFDPLEFLERLAVLTPRPRVNLILYSGVLAARAAWRSALLPATPEGGDAAEGNHPTSLTGGRAAGGRPGPERINGPS